jgi:dolichyl-phosphate-mannose--protein O-mannosyl transferase
MGLGAVEGLFFAVAVLGLAVWQLWSLRDRD